MAKRPPKPRRVKVPRRTGRTIADVDEPETPERPEPKPDPSIKDPIPE